MSRNITPVYFQTEESITLDARELVENLVCLGIRKLLDLIADEVEYLHAEGEDPYNIVATELRLLGFKIEEMEKDFN